jgi:redox-sensitive bicupin YhaK (pirin superfamily)
VTDVLEPRERDLGDGFMVRRLLPSRARRAVGPFLFFDHFGPTRMPAGTGMDVRPHPHVNLATVTYLFEGEMLHRDSLGSEQTIRPGDVNWMTAGRGIVHSERTPPAARAAGSSLHGLQLWVGLPRAHEETAPEFQHHAGATLPRFEQRGVEVRVLVGEAFGRRSPVATLSRVLYLDVRLAAGSAVELPGDAGDLGAYVIDGALAIEGPDGEPVVPARMALLPPARPTRLRAEAPTRLVVVGGDPFPEPRHIWWNFVSSSEARIDRAAQDWRDRRGEPGGPFPLVPGDEIDFIPAPER